ncbi:MAG: VgrG-related protein [Bacteroidia bacterium]
MPQSPRQQHNIDLVTVELLIDGSPLEDIYQIVSVEVETCLNRIPIAIVEVLDGSPAEQNFPLSETDKLIPGKELTIKAGYHQDNEIIFKGVIVSQALKVSTDEHSRLTIKATDKAAKMTINRKSKTWVDSKDSDIFAQIIQDHGLSSDATATTVTHKSVVQYQSTDWDFVLLRADLQGMVVLADQGKVSVVKPRVSGQPVLTLTYGDDIVSIDADLDARTQLSEVRCSGWDHQNQQVLQETSAAPTVNTQGNIDGKKLAQVLSSSPHVLASSGAVVQSELKVWADGRMQRAHLARIRGQVTFHGSAVVKPNSLIELKGLGARFNGQAYVSAVRHRLSKGSWTVRATMGLSPYPFVEATDNIELPPAGGMLPGVEGLHVGVVVKIHEDPDGDHRIQVKLPTVISDSEVIWARMAHLYATNNAGSFFLPEVGDEVLLGFLSNDPRYPVILGMLYSKKHAPPYTADEKNTYKAFVSNKQMKLVFDDDKVVCHIETPAGNKITLDDDKKTLTIVDQNGNKIELSSSGIVMDSCKDIQIKASQGKVSIEGAQGIDLKSSGGDVSAEGLNVNAKGSIAFKAEGAASAEVKSSGQTAVKGSIVMIN